MKGNLAQLVVEPTHLEKYANRQIGADRISPEIQVKIPKNIGVAAHLNSLYGHPTLNRESLMGISPPIHG